MLDTGSPAHRAVALREKKGKKEKREKERGNEITIEHRIGGEAIRIILRIKKYRVSQISSVQKRAARRVLCLLNKIVDWYISRNYAAITMPRRRVASSGSRRNRRRRVSVRAFTSVYIRERILSLHSQPAKRLSFIPTLIPSSFLRNPLVEKSLFVTAIYIYIYISCFYVVQYLPSPPPPSPPPPRDAVPFAAPRARSAIRTSAGCVSSVRVTDGGAASPANERKNKGDRQSVMHAFCVPRGLSR